MRHRASIENHVRYVSYLLYLCLLAKFPYKILTIIVKFKYLTFDPTSGSGGGVKLLSLTHLSTGTVIMTYSEKLSDNIVLEKCELYFTKKSNIVFALA